MRFLAGFLVGCAASIAVLLGMRFHQGASGTREDTTNLQITALARQLEALAADIKQLKFNPAKPSEVASRIEEAVEVTGNPTAAPERASSVSNDGDVAAEARRLMSILWLCTHDKAVSSIFESRRRSPFDPSAFDAVQWACRRLCELQIQFPFDPDQVAKNHALANQFEQGLRDGKYPGDEGERVKNDIILLRKVDDTTLNEYLRRRSEILDDLQHRLD